MITQATQQLNAALLHDHLDDVLCTLLQLVLAVEAKIQSSARVFEARLNLVERQEHASTIAVLRDRDMLSFLSAAPPETALALRQLIQTSQSTQVAEWYRQQWNQPDYSTELILASIANSLRPIMTIVLGNTALLSRLITLSTEELAALQPIRDAIEILRASRTQIQNYLASKGIAIQSF